MEINFDLHLQDLENKINSFWQLSGEKILAIKQHFDPSLGTPVFTVKGHYTTRGWTEWTQGFQFGSSILQFDATHEPVFLDYGRGETVDRMAPHISHIGVHDHGFNNLSTYGNLLRLMAEGKIPDNQWEKDFYKLALKISGAEKTKIPMIYQIGKPMSMQYKYFLNVGPDENNWKKFPF